MDIAQIIKYLSEIFGVFKGNEALKDERARRKEIRNDVREKRAELKINQLNKRLKKRS